MTRVILAALAAAVLCLTSPAARADDGDLPAAWTHKTDQRIDTLEKQMKAVRDALHVLNERLPKAKVSAPAAPPADAVPTYASVLARVAAGEKLFLCVDANPPPGVYEGALVPKASDLPAGIAPGVYECWFDGAEPKFRNLTAPPPVQSAGAVGACGAGCVCGAACTPGNCQAGCPGCAAPVQFQPVRYAYPVLGAGRCVGGQCPGGQCVGGSCPPGMVFTGGR